MTTPSLELSTSTTQEVPRGRAGWWHEYVCPLHGTELRAEASTPGSGPAHRCPHGCEFSGEPYDGAWRVLQLQRCAREFRDLAHRYAATGLETHREAAQQLLSEFCAVYADAVAGGWTDSAATWMLRGKLFHQALTEAIWGTSLAHGMLTLFEGDARWGLSSETWAPARGLFAGLLATVTEARSVLVEDRGDLRNNYTAWLISAGASCSRVLSSMGDPVDEDSWLDGPAGLWSHVDVAIHPDGWEWEAATYYHFFVLRAYLLTLRGRDLTALPPEGTTRIVAMLRVLVDLSTDGGVLPVLNDGPYRRREALQELLEVYVLGRQLVDLPGLERVEAGTRALLGAGHSGVEDQLDSWFSAPPLMVPRDSPAHRGSVRFADAGHVVVRPEADRWQAVLDAGPHGGAHGHLAKLALYLYGDREVWQPAPGVPPYGSSLRHRHYTRTLAHPTVRVDGLDQAESPGRLLVWDADGDQVRAVAAAPDAYPGVVIQRHLVMRDGVLLDAVHVKAEEARDLVLALRPADRLDAHAQDGLFLTTWADGSTDVAADRGRDLLGTHVCSTESEFALTPVRGPSDDPARVLGGVDWSVHGTETWFVSLYQPAAHLAHPRPRPRIVSTTDHGLVLEVTPSDGAAFVVTFEPVAAAPASADSEQGEHP